MGDAAATTSTTVTEPSTSSTTSTTTSSTTSTTLLRVCDLIVPSPTEVAACDRPRLRHHAEKKLMKIERALANDRQPMCRRMRRLRRLLDHCAYMDPALRRLGHAG